MAKGGERKWGEDAVGPFYVGVQDSHGHRAHIGDMSVMPWVRDALGELVQAIPAYKGKIVNAARDCIVVGMQSRSELISDPASLLRLQQLFQLISDCEEQASDRSRFAAMADYVTSTRMTLEMHADAGNWMLVSKYLEQAKKRIEDTIIWEPHLSATKKLISEYTKKLKAAKI